MTFVLILSGLMFSDPPALLESIERSEGNGCYGVGFFNAIRLLKVRKLSDCLLHFQFIYLTSQFLH